MLSQIIKKRAYFQKPHTSNKHHHHTHTPINFEFSRLDMENRHKLGLWNLLICPRLRFFPHVFLFSLVKPLRPLTSLEWLQVDRQIYSLIEGKEKYCSLPNNIVINYKIFLVSLLRFPCSSECQNKLYNNDVFEIKYLF